MQAIGLIQTTVYTFRRYYIKKQLPPVADTKEDMGDKSSMLKNFLFYFNITS